MEYQGSVYPVVDDRRRLLYLTLLIKYKAYTESAIKFKVAFSFARLLTEMLQADFNQERRQFHKTLNWYSYTALCFSFNSFNFSSWLWQENEHSDFDDFQRDWSFN